VIPRAVGLWLGIAVLGVVALWVISRQVTSPVARLALRCLVVATVLMPQPLWIPGQGAAVMPAVLLLASGLRPSHGPEFALLMGAFPIVAGAAVLFVVAGWRLAGAATGPERLVHRAARRWVAVGLLVPLVVLLVVSPFLALFGFGGPIAVWGLASALVLTVATAMDWRAARRRETPADARWIRIATLLLAALFAVVVLALTPWHLR
jgi:hypothetical protein